MVEIDDGAIDMMKQVADVFVNMVVKVPATLVVVYDPGTVDMLKANGTISNEGQLMGFVDEYCEGVKLALRNALGPYYDSFSYVNDYEISKNRGDGDYFYIFVNHLRAASNHSEAIRSKGRAMNVNIYSGV